MLIFLLSSFKKVWPVLCVSRVLLEEWDKDPKLIRIFLGSGCQNPWLAMGEEAWQGTMGRVWSPTGGKASGSCPVSDCL